MIVGGAIAVHLIWTRIFHDPFLYLGARGVDSNDPIMRAAREKALATLPAFFRLFPKHPNDCMVKFKFETDQKQTEFLWGDLREVAEDKARVFLRTPPVNHKGELPRDIVIPISDIVDWQLERQDGTLRGGFSNLALFKIYEREEGRMHPKFAEQVARFKDLTPEEQG
jgi:uncharacterized protein YegJ (DUF2314 family)